VADHPDVAAIKQASFRGFWRTMEPVSLRAYARHRGVSLRAVQKAIQAGRIEKTPAGKIDVQIADTQWDRRTAPRPLIAKQSDKPQDPQKQEAVPAGSPSRHPAEPNHTPNAAADPRMDLPRSDLPGTSGIDYSRARAVRETYLARMSKLDFEERSDKLVSRDEVEVAAFTKFRTFRDGMLNLPDRLAAILAAESDSAKVHEILATEIRKALAEFADDTDSR
jgi:hypothetical protein